MKVEPQTPLGVRITDIDVRSDEQLSRVRELLWKHGVVILPAGAAKPGTPNVHDDSSIAKLGSLFGTPEDYHPVNANKDSTDVVQILKTRGDSGIPADSFLFHSDISWRVNPSVASVLCAYEIPPKGGDTCFQSTNRMFHLLPDELRNKLYDLTFMHSLKVGYARVGRNDDVKKDLTACHPAIIKHPRTGVPLLYINSNFTTYSPELSREESDELLEEVFAAVYKDEFTLVHKWTKHDVVIWDNFGTQHLAMADYSETREMHRVVAKDPNLHLERYIGERASVKTAIDAVHLMLDSSANIEAYASYATRYDELVKIAGYVCPHVGTQTLAKWLKLGDETDSEQKVVLDVAAGTGKNALLFMENHSFSSVEALDYTAKMLSEARRRDLYRKYHVHDANTAFPFESGTYDGVICTGGLAPNQINPEPALSEMIRITKPGGYVVVTVREGNKAYEEAVKGLVEAAAVQMVEKNLFVGMKEIPEVQHSAFALQVA